MGSYKWTSGVKLSVTILISRLLTLINTHEPEITPAFR